MEEWWAQMAGGPRQPVRTTRHERRDSLYNNLTNMGTAGDKSAVARPNPFVRPLDDEELRALFNHDGIARRIVDILPEYSTREAWAVEGVDPQEEKRLQLVSRVQEAMTLAQLYGGAAMLLVTVDDIPRKWRSRPEDWLTQPLELDRVEELAAVHVFDTFEAHPLHEERDITNVDYRAPAYWSIGSEAFYGTVHASRVVQFVGRLRIPSERWSRAGFQSGGIFNRQQNVSYLQAVYDQIRYLSETMQGGAILAQELQKSIYKISGLDAITNGDQQSNLMTRLAAAQRASGVLGATAIGAEDDFMHVAGTPSGFRDLSEGAMQMLSFVTGIPQAIWFGEAPAGLSTDGDSAWKGFRQKISSYQEYNRSQIERIYQVMGSAKATPGTIDPKDVSLVFHPLDEPTNLELAESRLRNAQADSIEIENGVLGPEEVRQRYTDDRGYRMELDPLPDITFEQATERVEKFREAGAAGKAASAPFGGRPTDPDPKPQRNRNTPPGAK